ncbi:Efflux pump aflT [Colletotrichum sp. SAR 10_70]|nr:Efflux pump aflT [Colletotrichum sp. SAR 10_71]KAI8202837.1 Efflux pump aflT [Colletotrichum sp. SAR 10_70]KAI8206587.1 Efflux pump aflT [Colletotrichum sp. SAR 10_65]KAI8214888.1 Efflux pump aflT [Colletotrichum sp. SAR 10_76]KAI8238137.1 Efflux pump aflT [Colletotrichum sp. SAR 10_86]KAJ5007805.1 Efflux pump aflT [Colletotrichum sp. SAR 10_66]
MFFKKNQSTESHVSAQQSDASTYPNQNPVVEDTDMTMETQEATHTKTNQSEDVQYPSGLSLVLVLGSLFISMFLVSLDRLIITTAIPKITDEFDSVTDVGWYGSVFLLTTCAFQLLFGKIYSFYSIKATFLVSVLLFEVGSAICGAAPSSDVFIFGRALAGVGSAGILTGVIIVIVHAVPLHKRPMYQGMFGAVFGIASIIGPLVGGAFTTKLTWRWCFYINLPFGGVAALVIVFLLKLPDREASTLSTKAKLAQLDFYGTSVLIPGTVCLLLALQWGGLTYAWNNGRIVALLVLACVLLIGFVMVQIFLPKTATIPPKVFKQRSILAGVFATFCIGSQNMIIIYYLPIWFQAIQGVSAVESGIRLLPLVLSMVVASLMTGGLIRRTGYYTPFLIVGVCFMSVGAGLLNTLQLDTPSAKWIGYQILYGFGTGCASQVPNIAAQTVLPKKDVPIGTSLMFFSQLLGGAIFISVGQNVLNNQLLERLSSVPGFNSALIESSGATSLTDLPASVKQTVLVGYNESLRVVFRLGLILTCLSILGALAMEWRSVKQNTKKGVPKTEESQAAEKV